MKKILIALLVLSMSLTFIACGKKDSETSESPFLSLEELLNDAEFLKIIADSENEMFTFSASYGGDNVMVYEAHTKKTYDDVEYLQNLTTEEISDKFGLAELRKLLKRYGFGNVTIVVKMYNGDGTLITERTVE